jgi:hypothetical protein
LSIKKLKKGKDPRPFSSYAAVSDVPFVLYIDYKEEEVKGAIDLLIKDRIIKVIYDIFPWEIRYDIANEDLKRFVKDVWLVHDYDFRLLIERLVYNDKPATEDKNYLKSLFGQRYAGKILADIYHVRNSYEKVNNNVEEQKRIAKKFIADFDNSRRLLVQDIVKRHQKVIKEYEIASELIEEICFPSFLTEL